MKILENINGTEDLKALNAEKLPELCKEIREFLLNDVSQTGGHLASNLGVVELTVAIHRVFDTEKDRLVFDVGHQSYVHKLLTGRREAFKDLRKFGGLSGFPKPSESVHDAFIAGHASNSISVALGMARARTLLDEKYNVIALIGDGAMTGGLSFEGLNNAGNSGEPLVVILNDNGMSISKNVGGFARYLASRRIKPAYYNAKRIYKKILSFIPGGSYIYRFTRSIKNMIKKSILPCSMFEEMGFQYLGPVDGHDVNKLIYYLERAKELNVPTIVHVVTVKGKGYEYSENQPEEYHGVGSFDLSKGVECSKTDSFSEIFGDTLSELASADERICAITAAMGPGTGLGKFAKKYPERFFDVGIAEEHAVAMAGGMAAQGLIPVVAIYSTFLQRAYDMLIHDVALMNLHVVLAVDRAGIVGADGETHQGIFDISFLSQIPGMTILCPASFAELKMMMEYAINDIKGPVAVRYPRGGEGKYSGCASITPKIMLEGNDITIITYGTAVNRVITAAVMLKSKGISSEVIKLGCVKPLDTELILKSLRKTGRLMVVEDCIETGCIGKQIASLICQTNIIVRDVILKNTGSDFVRQGESEELFELCKLDAKSIVVDAEAAVKRASRVYRRFNEKTN